MEIKDSVLIIGYRRAQNLSNLISTCLDQGVRKIYISLDNVKQGDLEAKKDHLECLKIIEKAITDHSDTIYFRALSDNVGCAVGVISACDWFFSQEPFGIVLEDDCIPSKYFFEFVNNAKIFLFENDDLWLLCGTQFAQSKSLENGYFLSKYALTWGWATFDFKWFEISRNLRKSVHDYHASFKIIPEDSYWFFGALRAEQGFVDVWDTILLHRMLTLGKKAILPYQNLITNVGYDDRATHTKGQNQIKKHVGIFESSPKRENDREMDNEIKKEIYQIRCRHLLSNRVRRLLDLFSQKTLKSNPIVLNKRLL